MSTLRVSNIEAKADASSPTINEKLKVTNSNGDVLIHVNGETSGITSFGINTDNPAYNLDFGESPSTIRLISENNGTAIRVGAGDDSNDVTLLRVDGATNRNDGESDVGGRGFSIKYMGSGTGNNNSLSIFGDNGIFNGTGPQVQAITVLQDGKIGIGTDNPQGIVHISSGTSGDATLILEADIDNNDESDNPNIIFRQDGGLNLGSIGMNFTNSSLIPPSNELYVAASSTNAAIVFATGTSNNYTSATERLRITSGGNVGINTDNPAETLSIAGNVRVQNSTDASQYLTINHQGIDFQNTGVGSSTTSSAHLLEDYEEGTFTPFILSGITSPVLGADANGVYTKIGRTVMFTFDITVSSGTGNGDVLAVGGFPFVSESIPDNFGAGIINYNNIFTGFTELRGGHMSTGQSSIIFYNGTGQIRGNTSGVNWLSGRRIIVTGIYNAG